MIQKSVFPNKKIVKSTINGLFFLWCSVQNRNPFSNVDPQLHVQHFFPNLGRDIETDGSPSRILSNLFWRELPWGQIVKEIGLISVLDTGCGSGSYGNYVNKCSQENVKSYVGLDVYQHPSWNSPQEISKRFQRFDGKSIASFIPDDINFFMSQSAIEHFRHDQKYFQEIQQFIKHHPRPIIQVHLLPSVACMKLYGRHGYRQYTPRTVSNITRLFPDAQCLLFGLGGPSCNRVHESYITRPLATEGADYRETKPDEYKQKILEAIQLDRGAAPMDPSFWALVICSNWKQPFVL